MTTETKRREYYLAHENRYWIRVAEPPGFEEVIGQPVGIEPLPEADIFAHEADSIGAGRLWGVSCGVTGYTLTLVGLSSAKAATRYAGWKIKAALRRGWNPRESIQQVIAATGLSPRYRFYDEEPE